MDDRFAKLLSVLASDPWLVSAVFGILLLAIAFYWFWFRASCTSIEDGLQALTKALKGSPDWTSVRDAAKSIRNTQPAVSLAWRETEERVVEIDSGTDRVPVAFGIPRDIWSPSSVLSRKLNLPLAEAAPNLLVGVGLLMTFLFLTVAVTSATDALQPGIDPQQAMPALRELLRVTGAKFMTSLAGLLASLVWTVCARRWMARLGASCDEVLKEFSRVVRTDAAEFAMGLQVRQGHSQMGAAQAHINISEGLLTHSKSQADVLFELLVESREQTGTFKRFETDLAVSLAAAINNALSPKFEDMTKRLIGSIDGLSDRLGMMNQDALRQMTEDFSAMLQRMTQTELGQLKDALEELSKKLTAAGGVFITSAEQAGGTLAEASGGLATQVEGIATQLSSAAASLSNSAGTFDGSVGKLAETVDRATESGRRGADFVDTAVEDAREALQRLAELSTSLQTAAQDLRLLSGRVADAVDSVDELATAQKQVVQAVKDATPTALASVEGVVRTLGTAVSATEASMTQTKEAMSATASSLARTVAQITEGVTQYSETIANLHEQMDQYLAKAVGSLGKSIEGLDESVEELSEVMGSRAARRP